MTSLILRIEIGRADIDTPCECSQTRRWSAVGVQTSSAAENCKRAKSDSGAGAKIVHDGPESVFTLRRNRRSRWPGKRNAVRCATVLPQGHKYTGVYSHHSVRLNRSFLFTFAWRLTRLTRPSPILHLGGPPCRPGRQLRAFCARRFYASRLVATFSAAPSLVIRRH